jgi:pyrimidine operon attenuation protein/uracil phosphoribosyltransferase
MSSQILTSLRINKILKRIAFQVLENNFEASEICLVGINGQGHNMARQLKELVQDIKPELKVLSWELHIDKTSPKFEDISMDNALDDLRGKAVVVVDDVMNTGRTQAYAISYLLKGDPSKLETAVLVNRQHTKFAVAATYSGISLSTTLDEHIEVRLENEVGAYLY